MLSEKEMENIIINNPYKYLGEKGLKLLSQQYRIGHYIFDLLYEDRYGAKLIVELQRGTLDRNHTYKILDYYDEFKESNPREFIELIIIANKIPQERKRRLSSWGITFKEIPESVFLQDLKFHNENAKNEQINHINNEETIKVPKDAFASYLLFKEQKDKFVDALIDVANDVTIKMNWKELKDENIKNRINWFIGFIPNSWGKMKKGLFGVHFGFLYYRNRISKKEFVRLSVGVESPLKQEYKSQFKNEIVQELKFRKIKLPGFRLYPNAGLQKRTKLIESDLIPLDSKAWEVALQRYSTLNEFINIVSKIIKNYNKNGCFKEKLEFPV